MIVVPGKNEADFSSLTIESEDDLWYLYNIIDNGDLVRSVVMRRVEQQSDMTRSKETSRKPITVTITVEDTSFQDFSGMLKILGKVIVGPEDAIGSHQSVNIEPGSTLDLMKGHWTPEQKKMLKEAEEQKLTSGTYFIACDEDEASLYQLRTYGIKPLGKVESGRTGKYFETKETAGDYYQRVGEMVLRYVPKRSQLIVLGSPFTAEKMARSLQSMNTQQLNIAFFNTNRTDEGAVYEFLRGEKGGEVLKNSRITRDASIVNEFLIHLKSDGKAAYGYGQVRKNIEMGAVDTLLITDKEFRTQRGRELLELASASSAAIHVVSAT
ncbi:MAG: mRNA surveillance protein Pelota, partial [Thermoplasmataceae archaeon]